ncbi:MAG: aminotransferase class I/II-fold pyridoxal phosphate-dependent enzyme, partial [Eggerthellaceae bacterium]|nr:aminotransferase class I/II-fold pyridoxal phosphate-dependent enzyme [Eggerthellaceae bacterium]
MSTYKDMSKEERRALLDDLMKDYEQCKAKGLKLNMSRGKPSKKQLELSMPMLGILGPESECTGVDGTDCRNYGVLDGIPEAKELMAIMLDDDADNVIVLGNSSLTAMYDEIVRFMMFGTHGMTPWKDLDRVKWLCPSPGYDRHFAIMQDLGIEMIPVPMKDDGPDMDIVEELAAKDESIKGIWCVPKYSNPTGATYSDGVVRRLASMETAAPDFRIFWDNAYSVHHLSGNSDDQDELLDIGVACREAENDDRYIKFASTSKVTFPGAGIAALATSPENRQEILDHMSFQAIGPDKLNQLRHVLFLKDEDGIREHLSKQAEIINPKFALVREKLEDGLGEADLASWSDPNGGYFISYDGLPNTAKRTVELAKGAGVVLTGAGATWPYGIDPDDTNIRIAPTMPSLEELD